MDAYHSVETADQVWYLPDGRTLRVVANPNPHGGVTYLFDDVTERFALESRYNALIDVQRETLDSLKEGVAVFATRRAPQALQLGLRADLAAAPQHARRGPAHRRVIARVPALCSPTTTPGRASARRRHRHSDARQPMAGQMERPDDSVLDFAVAPLPDGATLITFVDVTDSECYERALIERNEALVAADRLKNQFISHVSYELRTPLTNIIGFSELLTSPRTGPLNDKQREYLDDISASSRTLLAIINDILDLATIDAGALELKLAPVKVASRSTSRRSACAIRTGRAASNQLDIRIADDAGTSSPTRPGCGRCSTICFPTPSASPSRRDRQLTAGARPA